jgi:hypothetical protein
MTYLLAILRSCIYWKFGVSFPLLAIMACERTVMQIHKLLPINMKQLSHQFNSFTRKQTAS